MSKGFASNYRIVLLAAVVLLAFGGLGARLVWLQVIGRGPLLQAVEQARREVIVEGGRRGNIVDARGNIFATSTPLIVLGVDPQSLVPGDEKKWPQLAALLGLPEPQLEKILTTRFRAAAPAAAATAGWGSAIASKTGVITHGATAPSGDGAAPAAGPGLVFNLTSSAPAADDDVLDDPEPDGERPIRWAKLSDEVSEATYAAIEKLNIRGLTHGRIYRRAYPHNELAAHLIGYVNREEQPVSGLERYADFYLRGQDGWVESEKDGRRQELAQFRTREVPAANGYSVVLSLDATIQHIVESELDHIVKTYQPLKATIIVSDPRTGFILALANSPTFNLNAYNEVPKEQQGAMRDIAATDQYEPGSVFKIVTVSAALDTGLVTPATTFDCTLDHVTYRNSVLKLPHEDEADHFDRPLRVSQIISESSNKGAAQLGMLLGERRLYDYARAFGFGSPTGFPGGDIAGTLARPEKWDGTTIVHLPMGHAIAVTALQMHQAMGVIASGGMLLRPQIIKEIRDADGEVVYRFGRSEVRRVISEQTARTMARLLLGVTTPVPGDKPTGTQAAIPGYEVAGKTGTAQMVIGGHYSNTDHVASFMGFFPASHPQLAISVIVHDADPHAPRGKYAGGFVSAPSFKNIANQLITYLHISQPGAGEPVLAMEGTRR